MPSQAESVIIQNKAWYRFACLEGGMGVRRLFVVVLVVGTLVQTRVEFFCKIHFFVPSNVGLAPFPGDLALNLEELLVRQSFCLVVGGVVPLRLLFVHCKHLNSVHCLSAATHLQARVLHVDRVLH